MNETAHMPLLTIPTEAEGSTDFIQRLGDLVHCETTHIYIDTSFLMWMTKIGSVSRRELIDWLQHNCAGRVHVPIWSAHEYLKHHVAETIVEELSQKNKEVQRLVRRAYTYFRPFIDEPLGEGGEDPSSIRSDTRVSLNKLHRLTEKISKWNRSYQKHASEVISFINSITPQQTSVYELLDNISQIGNGRFVGSVPPGHKDRWKKRRDEQSRQSFDEALAGSNRYGDLVFWKEILFHAKHMKAAALVVITNDRKNDWYLGGSNVGNVDTALRALRQSWKPVPRPHPMLVMEAKLFAQVKQVELLDSAYLAVLLRDDAEPKVRAFADVAIIPDSSDAGKEDDEQATSPKTVQEPELTKPDTELVDKPYLFSDSEKVINTRGQFTKALFESRNDIDHEMESILQSLRTSVEKKLPLSETITSDTLHDFDHKQLACLARELHDRVLGKIPGYQEAVADLVSILDEIPLNTAASLYLGLLASMYLVRETNQSRIPPYSPVAEFLFNRQSADYAIHGVYVVAKRLADNEYRPLYLPNRELPSIKMTLDVEPDGASLNELSSLTIEDTELLTPAQNDDNLRLGALFDGNGSIHSRKIIQKACELFAIPYSQVEPADMFKQSYNLTETVGFKRPDDIAIPKGQIHGK